MPPPKTLSMSPFAQMMSDDDIAAVVTYIRVTWDNRRQPVTSSQVNPLRQAPLFD